jgi:hypothetical protein
MFSWFRTHSSNKIGFDDVLYAIKNPNRYILINTLPNDSQNCLIKGTIPSEIEEQTINNYLNQSSNMFPNVIIYGKNSTDLSVDKKERQLIDLGFDEVHIYSGGMFEWLLLQDIYGISDFPSTSKTLDILKYRPHEKLHILRIHN